MGVRCARPWRNSRTQLQNLDSLVRFRPAPLLPALKHPLLLRSCAHRRALNGLPDYENSCFVASSLT